MNTIQEQYIFDRREYLLKLKEKQIYDRIERIQNQTEKMAEERVRDKQRIENDKGRYVDIKA